MTLTHKDTNISTALHEAAHVVYARSLGWRVPEVTILSNPAEKFMGRAMVLTPGGRKAQADLICLLLVGYLAAPDSLPAGKAWPPRYFDAFTETKETLNKSMAYMKGMGGISEDEYESLCDRAKTFVGKRRNKDLIRRVAIALLDPVYDGTISEKTLDVILRKPADTLEEIFLRFERVIG